MSSIRLPVPALLASLGLTSLLLGGCATEKTLTEQTQPMQDRLVRLEQGLAALTDSSTRTLREQTATLAARQDGQAKQASADIHSLREQLRLQGERVQALGAHASQVDRQVAESGAAIQAAHRQTAALASKLEAGAAVQATQNTQTAQQAGEQARALGQRVEQADKRLQGIEASALQAGQQVAALKAQQDSEAGARKEGDAAIGQRLGLAEQRIKDLSTLVQEAMAQAAKEIFLLNGKEAFTVTLTDDKVIFPQNDPSISEADAAKLNDLAVRVQKLGKEYHLDIQGHTDNFSTDDNNYNLGKARAEVTKRYLHERKGLPIGRMSTLSYGANKPLDRNSSNNRRIFIRVLVLK